MSTNIFLQTIEERSVTMSSIFPKMLTPGTIKVNTTLPRDKTRMTDFIYRAGLMVIRLSPVGLSLSSDAGIGLRLSFLCPMNQLEVSVVTNETNPVMTGITAVGSGWASDCKVKTASFRKTDPGSLEMYKNVDDSKTNMGSCETGDIAIVNHGEHLCCFKSFLRFSCS